jgi:L-fuconolactonase
MRPTVNNPIPGTNEWLDLVTEEIVDPDRPIIDPHHHLWHSTMGGDYLVDNLWQDTGSGHNVVKIYGLVLVKDLA